MIKKSNISNVCSPLSFIQSRDNSDGSLCLWSYVPPHACLYTFYIMVFGLKTEMTQPRCGADLSHAVSLIAAPLLNTNVHLPWLCRLNRCLVSIQSQISWCLISALFNAWFPFRRTIGESIVNPLPVYWALSYELTSVATFGRIATLLTCYVTNFEHVYITVGNSSKSLSHILSISSSCLFFEL